MTQFYNKGFDARTNPWRTAAPLVWRRMQQAPILRSMFSENLAPKPMRERETRKKSCVCLQFDGKWHCPKAAQRNEWVLKAASHHYGVVRWPHPATSLRLAAVGSSHALRLRSAQPAEGNRGPRNVSPCRRAPKMCRRLRSWSCAVPSRAAKRQDTDKFSKRSRRA